ncbi:C40 family peptidase [Yaniella halotolerans]|uniref:C40 family peptidase n=1 Tax=Yaniella halotolerans TaxID=225453 RepID=UPI0003B71EFE|nr:LysM peptidoglycan-binding domain-containing C40 family peptidase [Yaniella halotolerans]
MTFTTRRARIEAENAELLALRSRRNKKFSMGIATLATAASASFIGMAPANAAMDDAPAPATSSSSSDTTSNSSSGSYTVQTGDTLASIASSQGVALDALLNANGLSTSSVIYPGDVLQLSGNASSAESSGQSADAGVGLTSGETSTASADSDISTVSTASTGSGSATGTTAATSAAVDIVNSGATYQYGANGPSAYDCSGFTKAAFAEAGVELPRTSSAQFSGASSHDSLDNVQEGDLIFWSNNGSASGIYHVAVYVGDGQIAQARNPQAGISIDSLSTYTQYNPPMNTVARY